MAIDEVTRDDPGAVFSDPAGFADMATWHERAAAVRATAPVLEVDDGVHERFWALTRHRDVLAVSRDSATWRNTHRSILVPRQNEQRIADAGMPPPRSLVHLDGVDHRDHRMVTNDWFKPAAVKRRQPRIDALADLFLDRMRELGGECDFARDIAQPFTLRVIMDIYGVPEEDEPLMLELTQGVFGSNDPEFSGPVASGQERFIASLMRFIEYFDGLTEDRRRSPADDLATVIATGQPGGCPIGDGERLWYFIIVATAGHDTTSFALAGGLQALLDDPSQLDLLRRQPELVVGAAEECLRWTSPVRHFLRYAAEDTTVGDVDVPAGGRVLLSYPSANRDEEVFADAGSFRIDRPDADRNLAFGLGTHFCLGAQFARQELRSMLTRLARDVTDVELAGPAETSESTFVSGVKHLPIRYRLR